MKLADFFNINFKLHLTIKLSKNRPKIYKKSDEELKFDQKYPKDHAIYLSIKDLVMNSLIISQENCWNWLEEFAVNSVEIYTKSGQAPNNNFVIDQRLVKLVQSRLHQESVSSSMKLYRRILSKLTRDLS